MRRALAVVIALLLGATACSDAPETGDLASFCSLLEQGIGLDTTSPEADYAQLALVAPPDVRPTIESLQTQARDFDELLNMEPPDLDALFTAKFDPAAASDRAALDRFAEDTCGLDVDRPPSTRWANHVRANHATAAWRNTTTATFEVGVGGERVSAVTVVFAERPEPLTLIEDVCRAVAGFLVADGSDDASVTVLIGTVVMLEQPTATGSCRLP